MRTGWVLAATSAALAHLSSCSLFFESSADGDAGAGQFDAEVIDSSVDARVEACPGPVIVPLSEAPTLECGETVVRLPRVDVDSLPSGCELTQLEWTLARVLIDTSEEIVLNAVGAPDELIPIQARVLGGSFSTPEFNLTPYHGPNLVRMSGAAAGTNTKQFFQFFLEVVAGRTYRWRASVASSALGSARLSLFQHTSSTGSPNYGLSECLGDLGEVCEGRAVFQEYTGTFVANASASDARLRLSLSNNKAYVLDHVSIIDTETGMELVKNGSFEEGLTNWSLCVGCNLNVAAGPVGALGQYGEYRLRVRGVSTGGVEGDPVEYTFDHQPCDPAVPTP